MRRLLTLVVIAAPLFAASITQTAKFTPNDLKFTPSDGYSIVDLAGYPSLIQPGAPRVPRVVQAVAIPAGAEPVSVELTAEEWITLPGSYRLPPAQPDVPLPRQGETFTPRNYPPDPKLYASSDPYPARTIRLLETGTMAGYRIAAVELLPLRYIATTGEVRLATSLSYRITYRTGTGLRSAVPTREQRDRFEAMVRPLVVNPADVKRFAPPVRKTDAATFLPPGHYEYVVVTESPMDTVFQRLADWKTLKGVPGTVVNVSYVNANYTGYDLQEKIRNFIKDAYENWGTMYVLLGGSGDYNSSGQNIIPTRMGNYGQPDPDEPCDLYYAGLDGTWDANGNHTYGEVADDADMYSDVFVGRAPVYSVALAQNFVYKVMTYERNPPSGYLKKMLLATAILWDAYEERPMQESLARMTPAGWLDGRLYERTSTLSEQIMIDSMNIGYGMGQWDGHGNQSGIYMGGSAFLNSSDAQTLTNGDKLGVMISIACDCAGWDMVSAGEDCFAEHLVNRVGGGTVASIMNTRYGYGAYVGSGYVPGPSERLDTTFFAGAFLCDIFEVGAALGYSKAAWAPYADSTNQFDMQRYCIYDLNLLGDPEMPMWTDEPSDASVSHSGVVTIGNNIPYTVTISNQDAPVESALVLLWKGDEVYTKGRTDGSGQVTLYLSPATPGPMLLSVNAHDCYPARDTVMVIATDRYICHLRSTPEDPAPGGNGDSIMNPGETVKIPLWVKNWGSQTASGVTAKLRTRDANAQVTDSVFTFGTIAAGESASTGTGGFGLHVNSGLRSGYPVACSLVCRDAMDSVWVSLISYRVGAPVLEKTAVTIYDSLAGNGNGRVDAGETTDIEIAIRNAGTGHGYNCCATLYSGDRRVHVLEADAAYGVIRKGDTAYRADERFRIAVEDAVPPETPITCTLDFLANGGYEARIPFTFVVGELRAVDPIPDGPRVPARYYAFDDLDVSYPQHPTYEWVEIKDVGTALVYPQNDDVCLVDLPAAFGPFKFYGQSFSQISVSADGWVCPGNNLDENYDNTPLPDATTPPGMICANWDDLYPDYNSQGSVYWYHDAANHRLVIEYDSVAYYNPHDVREKFEIIIYDTTTAADNGDNLILVQYMTANRYASSTVGLEDPSREIGLGALYNGTYHRASEPIAEGRAILYIADSPYPEGIADEQHGASDQLRLQLLAWPNPIRNTGNVQWSVKAEGKVALKVFDASGREVRDLVSAGLKPGRYTATWDGKSNAGQTVSAGIYFYKLETLSGSRQQKVVVTR